MEENQEDDEDNTEEKQEEEEAVERRIALVEDVVVANHAMSHIREGLQNVSNDSDEHPIQYGD